MMAMSEADDNAGFTEVRLALCNLEKFIRILLTQLERAMSTIENEKADEMEAIRQTDEWKEAFEAAEKARRCRGAY